MKINTFLLVVLMVHYAMFEIHFEYALCYV